MNRLQILATVTLLMTAAGCASLPTRTHEQSLRVMSYNIEYGHEGLDSVIAVIRSEHLDVVGFQEVDVHWSARSNFVDQAALLAKGTSMEYRFARIYQMPNDDPSKPPREFGVAIMSRYPITAFTNREITRHSTQDSTAAPALQPGLLDATIDVNGTKVRVFDVHLDYRRDPSVRAQQVADMLRNIEPCNAPTLLFGDMNATPNAPELQPLLQHLHDTWPASNGPGATYPAKAPESKIDYVMTSDGFRVRKVSVPEVYASDHRPMVVDLEFPDKFVAGPCKTTH